MKTSEIRSRYLNFFKEKGHVIIPSASLIPENDPTTLFTGSGMQPMIRYFLGTPHPMGKRITDSQKSFRSQDIEEVGDNRHTTFFEMLGNWSFGDYFKNEQLPWIFEFLTKEVGLSPENLYVTCFRGKEVLDIPKDTDSAEIWQKILGEAGVSNGIQDFPERDGMKEGSRIFYYDEKKNWWSRSGTPEKMPEGEPGGPDSEIFWDFGTPHDKKFGEVCHVNCDCGRFLEIGNSVFMEYTKTGSGFEKLPTPNVDFGGGLERIAAASLNNPDIYRVDVFESVIRDLEKFTGFSYESRKREFRVIADHVRAATFLIIDGVLPSNKDRGYFVRRLLRRAILYSLRLKPDLAIAILVHGLADLYKNPYPELSEKINEIDKQITEEESMFRTAVDRGLKEFNSIPGPTVSGKSAAFLYQTYGLPYELIEELAIEKGYSVDKLGFDEEMGKHQQTSILSAEKKFKGGLAGHSEKEIFYHTTTHLLHQALREVLGDHVLQRGSNITSERLRFDFSYNAKMSDEEKKKVEEIVNKKISEKLPVSKEEMSLEEARSLGAIGLFGEKYGETVSIYKIGEGDNKFSLEFCGGPHVSNTGDIRGLFRITKEEAVSSGVRRIRAILE